MLCFFDTGGGSDDRLYFRAEPKCLVDDRTRGTAAKGRVFALRGTRLSFGSRMLQRRVVEPDAAGPHWAISLKTLWQGLTLILIPSVALIGLEVYQIARNVPELRRSQDLVAHTIEVITATQALERAIQDAERGQRGFLITGDAAYLDPYRKGVQEISADLSKLKQLTADNPEQQRRWPILEHQINIKLDELKRTIDCPPERRI